MLPKLRRAVVLLLTSLSALAAEDAWDKVRELKSGADLRIYKANTKKPVEAKLDRVAGDSLIVITKKGEVSIPREEIDRLDCRRGESGRIVTRAGRKIARKGAEVTSNTMPGATTSVTTGLELPSKPAFETVYDRAKPPDTRR